MRAPSSRRASYPAQGAGDAEAVAETDGEATGEAEADAEADAEDDAPGEADGDGAGLVVAGPVVSRVGAGKITGPGINCGQGGTDCTELYPPGTVVTLKATPLINLLKNIEWDLDRWEGACSGAAYTCTVTMSAVRTATAVFVRVDSGPIDGP